MSGYRLPPPLGRSVDRERRLTFRFDGRSIPAYDGDTIASALLASGVSVVGRSFKLHRPRGIYSCGIEEPTGVLDVGTGAERTPCMRATDVLASEGLQAFPGNCWPSLRRDAAAILSAFAAYLPAGFYYKTFMWPHWRLYEPAIRRLAGLGTLGDGIDPDRYEERSRQTDVLVIGAGAAGMQAALSAAQAGRSVLLLEAQAGPGGSLDAPDPADPRAFQITDALQSTLRSAGVEVRTRCTVVALYDHLLAVAVETPAPQATAPCRERLLKIRARHIVLATGAIERPMLFPDNDRPGVMLASAMERYASHFGVACGRRVVIATACDTGYRTARRLRAAGITVAAIVDRRKTRDIGDTLLGLDGVELLPDSAVIGVAGRSAVAGVSIASRGRMLTLDTDALAGAGGWTPNVSLYSQAGGRLGWLPDASMFVPDHAVPGISVIGAAAGVFDLDLALAHAADLFGLSRPGRFDSPPAGGLGHVPPDHRPSDQELRLLRGRPGKQFVDLQNDVTTADIALAARENYRSVEHLKRYTTTGMATDQGKTSNINALVLMGRATGRTPDEVGTTKFRPPYKPVTLSAIAGGRTGLRHRPLKRLSARAFHARRGALFEEFGGWERPAGYPRAGETLAACARREAGQVRAAVGLFDGSPLGKIEIHGPDAARFLDLMYLGTMSTLPVGGARYGLILSEHGVIADDGIVARLGPDQFWVNTTSGGAERTALAFDEWLQCEFTGLRAFVIPVSSQWGNVTVACPRAWQLLAQVGFDAVLAPA
ncbi:MAG: 2Fe-2S iron-sulfur cluster-binding protein, partial [Lautropia sp.]